MEEEEKEIPREEKSNANELMVLTQPFTSSQYVRDILAAVDDGLIAPLAAFVLAKRFEKVAKLLIANNEFKDQAIEEANKHLGGTAKSFDLYSATITKGATYTTYDFKDCNHPVLNELNSIKKEIEIEIKRIEDSLKLLIGKKPSDEFTMDGESEEILINKMPFFHWAKTEDQVTVYAPQKLQKLGIKFTNV